MSAIDEFNPAPAPDYETLLFQFKTLCRMYNSTRSQCSLMAKTIFDLNKQIADGALDAVESERAANAQLTAELEALRQERDGLRNTNHALAARLDELCRVRNERNIIRDRAAILNSICGRFSNIAYNLHQLDRPVSQDEKQALKDLQIEYDAAMAKEQGDGN